MASILETIANMVTPELISGVGKALGLSDEVARQGVTLANALIMGGLARTTRSEAGAARVAQMVAQADSSVLGNLGSVVSSAVGGSTSTAEQLFGNNLDLVVGNVKKVTGIDVKPLLAMGAPVVLGVVKNIAGQQQLDQDGIARLLQSELRGLARRDKATNQTLKELFKPLDVQEKVRARFSDAEWAALGEAPGKVAAMVMVADHSRGGGQEKELAALRAAVAEAVAASAPTELINMLFRDGVPVDVVERMVHDYRQTDELMVRKSLLGPVTEAMAAVRTNGVKDEAAAFQGLLTAVAQQVAAAAKEGGFLGMGGANVSADEQQALEAVAKALAVGA